MILLTDVIRLRLKNSLENAFVSNISCGVDGKAECSPKWGINIKMTWLLHRRLDAVIRRQMHNGIQ